MGNAYEESDLHNPKLDDIDHAKFNTSQLYCHWFASREIISRSEYSSSFGNVLWHIRTIVYHFRKKVNCWREHDVVQVRVISIKFNAVEGRILILRNFLYACIFRIVKEYENIIESAPGHSVLISTEQSISNYLLGIARALQVTVDSFYLAAATIATDVNGTNTIIAWFNNQPLHTAPLALNLVHNAALKAILGSDHNIRVINHPLPFTSESKREMLAFEASNNTGFQLATNLTFAMAFVAAFYVLFYIKVRLFFHIAFALVYETILIVGKGKQS